MSQPILILYMPVLHQGYLNFLNSRINRTEQWYLINDALVRELSRNGRREIREVPPEVMLPALRAAGLWQPGRIQLLTRGTARGLADQRGLRVTMPELQICRRLAEHYLWGAEIAWESIFLQWDEANVRSQQVVEADYTVSLDRFDRQMMQMTRQLAARSTCWWRQVGAVATRHGEVILTAYNRHVPDEQTHYYQGDPRDFVDAGADSHIATTLHSEQIIITQAARSGISLEDCDLYVPVFPCPMCAKQIAYAGFKRVLFREGHASLDGETILKSQGVELILVR